MKLKKNAAIATFTSVLLIGLAGCITPENNGASVTAQLITSGTCKDSLPPRDNVMAQAVSQREELGGAKEASSWLLGKITPHGGKATDDSFIAASTRMLADENGTQAVFKTQVQADYDECRKLAANQMK